MPAKLTHEFVKGKVEENGKLGLLSPTYENAHVKLELECLVCGNLFKMKYNCLQQGRGCPACAGNIKLTHEFVKEKIEENGKLGLLSPTYEGSQIKLELECLVCGHLFKMKYSNLQQGIGCPACAGTQKLTHEFVKGKVEENGKLGLLSPTYEGSHKKLELKCLVCGHLFKMIYNSLQQGYGCPQCAARQQTSKGEIELAQWIESYISKSVILTCNTIELNIISPNINKRNGSRRKLDVDILLLFPNGQRFAIEFNGNYWHGPLFPKVQKLDRYKAKFCKKNNINFLVVWGDDWQENREKQEQIFKKLYEEILKKETNDI